MKTEDAQKHRMWEKQLLIHGYYFKKTCTACPEQYDVYDQKDQQVAYLRLRHGSFTVTCPDVGGDVVYAANPNGDGLFDDTERLEYLYQAAKAIQLYYANRVWDEDEYQ